MKRLMVIMLLVLSFAASGVMPARPVRVPNGFVNGHAFMSYPSDRQSFYLIGVVDGMLAGASFGGNEKLGFHIKQCLSVLGGTSQTLLTAVKIYMNTHLDEWASGMQVIQYRVILQNCPLPDDVLNQ